VRHTLLPALRALHPAADANVLRTLELLRDEASVLDAVLDAALAEAGDPPRPPPCARSRRRCAGSGCSDSRRARAGGPRRSATARRRSSRWPRAGASTSAAACAPRCAAVR
jgi:hypothetical protein